MSTEEVASRSTFRASRGDHGSRLRPGQVAWRSVAVLPVTPIFAGLSADVASEGARGNPVDRAAEYRTRPRQPERVAHRVVTGAGSAAGFGQQVQRLENPGPQGNERDGWELVGSPVVDGLSASGSRTGASGTA